ncbi:flagellar assembly protein FliW [Paenibacillus tianjinensis]|uniref:Flagellar assembly factor FliW n=1 Tax=Paenibacillus tianjinensis TaxID=2810347 RepID=A0ABX7L9Z7_9BACL|nr:flagellar assembly protein FliW [Paenibacillus tianjinensis]QSF44736.1 flagellar assembly protein FliW [Paenibacillus tianjinensis]
MNIETSVLGVLDIKDEQIYHFPKGIPGFEQETEFAIIELEEGPFAYLQSLKTEELAFLLTDPFVFYPGYEFELPEAEAEELEIEQSVVVRAIVTLREKLEESTLNLLAPIVFNPDKRAGKQIVLHHSTYSTRQLLWRNSPKKEDELSC